MTYDISDATPTESDVLVETEVAGPPVRRREAPGSRRRALVTIAVLASVVVVVVLIRNGSRVGPLSTSTPSDHTASRSVAPASAASSTRALDELPQGLAPTIPYLQGGMLRLDGIRVRTTANRLLSSAGTVLLGRTGQDSAHWWILDGVEPVMVPELEGAFTPALSPRGDLVAWTSWPDTRTTRISVLDTTTGAVVDHVDLAAPYAGCCGGGQEVELDGFDLRGQLYWSQRAGIRVWRPGSGTPPHRLTGGGATVQVAPAGPVRQGGALGRVDVRGHWSKIGDLPTDQGMVWSDDGSRVAYAGDDTGTVGFEQSPTDAWVVDLPTGARTHLDLPVGPTAEVVAFESDDAVLVDAVVGPRLHHLLRCSVPDGACERTMRPGRPTWTFAEHSSF